MSTCPTGDTVLEFLVGTLPSDEADRIGAHTSTCQHCGDLIAEFQANDEIFGVLKSAVRGCSEHSNTMRARQSPATAPPSTPIRGYQLQEKIGEGGGGVVYKAIQSATRRQVALKVLHGGPFASLKARRRFEREVELVAQLEHPYIVTILESGITSSHHYFAMQFVKGQRLDAYLAGGKLPIKELLRLFVKICEGVSYAHQRGVVHRDLKPSNILIDTDGDPRILDFGVAKSAPGRVPQDAAQSLLSVSGQIVGTFPYMSPEQARGSSRDADIRSDVYSLGVILYEMLTGQRPYNTTGQIAEVIASITGDDPRRPSALNPQVGYELETIALKALMKDKERRYQSVDAFANDLRYYLAGEPIEAKRDSTFYVLRKNLMRYRVPLTVAAAFVLLLCVSLAVTWSLYSQARRREYAVRVSLAQHAYDSNQISEARSLLAKCPPELAGWEWFRLNWLSRDRSHLTLRGHEDTVTAVAFSPDGSRIVSASEDQTLKVWDLASGEEVLTLRGHTDTVLAVAISPDGGTIASGGLDKILRIWDASSGMETRAQPYKTLITSLAYSPDGRIIAAGDHDATIMLWDGRTGASMNELTGHHEDVSSIAFGPDGTRIVSGSMDRTVRIWDVQSGLLLNVLKGHEHQVLDVAFSPTDNTVASAAQDHTVRVWDLDTNKLKFPPLDHALDVTSVAFSPDGSQIITGCDDKALRIWNAATGEHLLTLPGHEDVVKCIAVNHDGTLVASGGGDRTVKVWDTDLSPGVLNLSGHWRFVRSLACSPDGKRVASAGRDSTVRVWSLETGEELLTFRGHTREARTVAFSPDGRRIVSGGSDNVLRLFDSTSGEELRVFPGHTDTINSVAFTPDGKHIISGGRGRLLRLFDATTGVQLRTFSGHGSQISSIAVSRDGKKVISGSEDHTVRLWDLASGQQIRKIADLEAPVLSVQFHPDGTRFVASCSNSTITILDASSGTRLLTLPGHEGQACSVAFSPDGRRVVSGGEDGRLRVWDATFGQEVWNALAGEVMIQSVAFTPDGASIISGGMNMPITVWESREPISEHKAARHAVAEARRLVDLRFDELLFAEKVIDRLEADPDLDDTIRESALRLARTRGDDPPRLDHTAWELVKFAGRETTDYEEGLRLARAACELAPDDPSFRTTLGAALYRVGRYEDALRTLCPSRDIVACIAACQEEEEPDLVYIAMSLHNIDNARVAGAALSRLRALTEKKKGDVNNELVHLLREAEFLIEKGAAPGGNNR